MAKLRHQGFEFVEQSPASPEEGISLEEGHSVLRAWFRWDLKYEFCQYLLGYTTVEAAASGQYFARHLPFRHPLWPGPSYLWANSVRVEPDRAPTGQDEDSLADFDTGLATITLDNRPYRILNDQQMIANQVAAGWAVIDRPDESSLQRFVTIAYSPRARYQTLPANAALRWNAAADPRPPVSATSVVIIVEADYLIQWMQIPVESLPITAINNCLGKTNSNVVGLASGALRPFGGTIGIGKLVMLQPEITRPYRQPNGGFAVNVTYKWQFFPRGSNALYRHERPSGDDPWQNASRDGNTMVNTTTGAVVKVSDGSAADADNLLYPVASFEGLFRPEP